MLRSPLSGETLLAWYGASLLRGRHHYDEGTRERLKTVELVVQRRSWEGEADCPGSRTPAPVRDGERHCGSAGGRVTCSGG